MSNSPMPDSGKPHPYLPALTKALKRNLHQALRKIEDSIDRIDPPLDVKDLAMNRMGYVLDQLLLIVNHVTLAAGLANVLKAMHELESGQASQAVEDATQDTSDTDIIDDVEIGGAE